MAVSRTGWLARVGIGAALVLAVFAAGTAGYMLVEGWSALDALYMTVNTASTVGLGEVHPLSPAGKLFTIGVIVLGGGALLYTLTNVVEYVVEGHLAAEVGGRVMEAKIERLRDHFVLCGFGRVGEQIAQDFTRRKVPFVVVDNNPEAIERASRAGCLILEGDASVDEALERAGIRRARGLVAASDSDAGNTYITLGAKAINPRLLVIARAGSPANEEKMRRAGADRVVSPYTLAGQQMALAATQPNLLGFVDTLVRGAQGEVLLAEIEVKDGSPLRGQTVAGLRRVARSATILAIRQPGGELVVGPPDDTTLGEGDQVMLIGEEQEVRALG